MRRTPPWVFIAAVGVQLAALALCLWAMERGRRAEEAEAPAPADGQPVPPASAEALAPPPAPSAAEAALFEHLTSAARSRREPEPVRVREPDPEPETPPDVPPAPYRPPAPPPAPRRVVIRAVQPPGPATPMFGPPPERPREAPADPNAISSYITEAAEATTQVVRGIAAEGQFAFGFYRDGDIRFVDVDGGRYAGKAESARARMREDGGTRAFTVQIGVAADGRLQATFTGGPHDAQTIALEPLTGWSAA